LLDCSIAPRDRSQKFLDLGSEEQLPRAFALRAEGSANEGTQWQRGVMPRIVPAIARQI